MLSSMSQILLLNKPFQVLSQFSDNDGKRTLAEFIDTPKVYPAGRLDYDSEGLLLLTGDGGLQARIADPRFKLPKHYWVQVEGLIDDKALIALRQGVKLKDGMTKPAQAERISPPQVWDRRPPIRQRKNDKTSWIELIIKEGRNRQVRRMTAAVGFPTLRLIRHKIGPWSVDQLAPGEYRQAQVNLPHSGTKTKARRNHNKGKHGKGHLRSKTKVTK